MSLTSSYVNPYLSPSYNPGFFNSLGMSGADEIKNWNPTGILQQKWNQPRERARLAKEYSDPISKEDYASLNLSTPWNDNMTEGDAFAILQVERTRNFDEKALFHAGLSGGTVRGLGMLGTRLSASMVDPVFWIPFAGQFGKGARLARMNAAVRGSAGPIQGMTRSQAKNYMRRKFAGLSAYEGLKSGSIVFAISEPFMWERNDIGLEYGLEESAMNLAFSLGMGTGMGVAGMFAPRLASSFDTGMKGMAAFNVAMNAGNPYVWMQAGMYGAAQAANSRTARKIFNNWFGAPSAKRYNPNSTSPEEAFVNDSYALTNRLNEEAMANLDPEVMGAMVHDQIIRQAMDLRDREILDLDRINPFLDLFFGQIDLANRFSSIYDPAATRQLIDESTDPGKPTEYHPDTRPKLIQSSADVPDPYGLDAIIHLPDHSISLTDLAKYNTKGFVAGRPQGDQVGEFTALSVFGGMPVIKGSELSLQLIAPDAASKILNEGTGFIMSSASSLPTITNVSGKKRGLGLGDVIILQGDEGYVTARVDNKIIVQSSPGIYGLGGQIQQPWADDTILPDLEFVIEDVSDPRFDATEFHEAQKRMQQFWDDSPKDPQDIISRGHPEHMDIPESVVNFFFGDFTLMDVVLGNVTPDAKELLRIREAVTSRLKKNMRKEDGKWFNPDQEALEKFEREFDQAMAYLREISEDLPLLQELSKGKHAAPRVIRLRKPLRRHESVPHLRGADLVQSPQVAYTIKGIGELISNARAALAGRTDSGELNDYELHWSTESITKSLTDTAIGVSAATEFDNFKSDLKALLLDDLNPNARFAQLSKDGPVDATYAHEYSENRLTEAKDFSDLLAFVNEVDSVFKGRQKKQPGESVMEMRRRIQEEYGYLFDQLKVMTEALRGDVTVGERNITQVGRDHYLAKTEYSQGEKMQVSHSWIPHRTGNRSLRIYYEWDDAAVAEVAVAQNTTPDKIKKYWPRRGQATMLELNRVDDLSQPGFISKEAKQWIEDSGKALSGMKSDPLHQSAITSENFIPIGDGNYSIAKIDFSAFDGGFAIEIYSKKADSDFLIVGEKYAGKFKWIQAKNSTGNSYDDHLPIDSSQVLDNLGKVIGTDLSQSLNESLVAGHESQNESESSAHIAKIESIVESIKEKLASKSSPKSDYLHIEQILNGANHADSMVILEGDPYADAAKWVANRMGWKGIETIRAEEGNDRDARLFITNEAGLDKTLKNPLIRRPLVIGHVAKSTPEDLQFPQDRSYILNDVKEQANAFIREEEARLKERNDAEIIRNATDQVPDDVKRDADDFQDNLPPASAPPAKVPPSGDSPLVSDGRPLEQNPYAFATIHSQDSLPDLASNVDEIRSSLELGHGQFTIKESVRSVEQKTEEGKEPTGATDDYQVVKVTFSDDFAPYMSKDIKKIANQIESLTWLFKVDPLSLDFRQNFRKHFRNLNPHQVRSILVDENIASAEHTVDFLINNVQNDEQLQGLLGVKELLADLQIRNKTAYLINVRGLMGMVKAIEKYDNLYKKLGNHEAAYFNFLQQVDYDKRALHDHYRGDLEVSLTRAGLKEKYTELEGESAARVYTALADLQRAYARGTRPESGSYITTYNRKQIYISNQEFEIARQLFQHEIRSLNHHNGYYDNVRWKGARGIMLQHNPTLIKDGGRDGRDAALNGLRTVGRMIDETKAGYGIPVAGMTRQQALETFMDWYKKEVTLDYNTMFGLYETVDNHNPFANNWKVKNNHWFTRSYLGTPETSGTSIYPPDQVRKAVDRWLADAFDKMTSEKVTDNMPINTSKLSTTFHFDHPMDRYRTMVKYSDYGLTDGIDQQIARMAKQTAYTKNFGLNPEAFSYAENAMNMLEPLSVLAKGDAGKMNSSMWPFLFSYRKLGGDYIGFARNLLELNKIPVNVGIGIASDTLKQLGLVSTGGFIGVSAIADAGGLSHGLRDIFGEALDAKRMDMLFNWSKDAAAKEELSALGTVLEDSAAAMLRVAQDHGIPLTPMLKLTNTFVNWTGVGQVTKAMREKFTSIFTWTVGHQANKSFDQLTPEMRSTIERYDINSNEWDFIRDNVRIIKGDMGEFPAVNELSNYSSDALTHILNKKGHTNPSESIRVRAANEITDKYQRMLRSEMDRRVLLPDSFDTALWTGGTQKGTLSHLVLDNMALFKSFGTAFFRKQLGPAVGDAIKGRPGSRWRLIEFMATMLAIGYVLTIIKDLLSNRKPRVWGKSAFVSSLNNSGIGGLYSSLLADEWSMNEDANVANRFLDYMGGVPKAKVDAYVRAFGSDDPGQFMQRMTKATMGVIPFNNHAAIKGALDIAITQPLSNVFNEEYINNRERFFEEHGTGSVFKWE